MNKLFWNKFIILFLFVFITGCNSNKQDVYEIYKTGVEKMSQVQSYTVNNKDIIYVGESEEQRSLARNSEIKKENIEDGKTDLSIKVDTDNIQYSYSAYYSNGNMYINFSEDNSKVKEKLEYDLVINELNVNIFEFSKDIINQSSVNKSDGGGFNIYFKFNSEKMTELLDSEFANIKKFLEYNEGKIKINEAVLTATIDKDSIIKNYNLKVTSNVSTENGDIPITYELNSIISNVGNTKAEVPENLEEYKEV